MDMFLEEWSQRYAREDLLLLCDGASCHQMDSPTVPDHLMLETLPPYCPD